MHNSATIVGYLGADPEVRYTQGGTAVATLRIATSERWRDAEGNAQERTDWHRVVVWGKSAEACGRYLTKGRPVLATGPLRSSEWTDQAGQRHWRYELHAERVVFLPTAGGTARERPDGGPAPSERREPSFGGRAGGPSSPGDDEIPF